MRRWGQNWRGICGSIGETGGISKQDRGAAGAALVNYGFDKNLAGPKMGAGMKWQTKRDNLYDAVD